MPVIEQSTYSPPLLTRNRHIQTVYPHLFRKIEGLTYTRERMHTPDGDFIDIDWSTVGSKRLLILTHGLEGSSRSKYVRGYAKAANTAGWDVMAWNMRGCSGEANLRLQSYHSGSSDDLQLVFSHALFRKSYQEIALVGFSLGGNLTLKFLGEQGASIQSLISGAVCFSVPCDLKSSAYQMHRRTNRRYLRYFMQSLQKKVEGKKTQFPHYLPDRDPATLRDFQLFDDYYTAPVHGFRSAEEYWYHNSARRFLSDIRIPTLIINASNDPFLTKNCFPYEEARASEFVHLEAPKHGGHVGFVQFNKDKLYWSEERGLAFLKETSALEQREKEEMLSRRAEEIPQVA